MKSAVVLCLAAVVALTGCRLHPASLLAAAGIEAPDPDASEGSGAPLQRVAVTQQGEVVLSGYQHAPTLDWTTLGIGQPFSVARSIFDVTSPDESCQLVSRGTPQVAQVPYAAQREPLAALGFVEVGISGNVAPARTLLTGEVQALGLQAVATSARLGTLGDRCSYAYLFLSLRLSADKPVTVLR